MIGTGTTCGWSKVFRSRTSAWWATTTSTTKAARTRGRGYTATNFDFAYCHTHFVVLEGAPGEVGAVDISLDGEVEGPREEALTFLETSLESADVPNRVVLTHMPPHLDGHYEPHPEWGFQRFEARFLELLRRYGVRLVCCAHGLAFDHHVHDGIRFVRSGGGGTGLCSDFRGICAEGAVRPRIGAASSTPCRSPSPRRAR